MTTLLLPRAKSSHNLALLLSVLLAFPSNLPTLEREDVGAGPEAFAPIPGGRGPGAGLHRPDRKSPQHHAEWSDVADEPEGFNGRDDFRYSPLALPQRPIDLPSLVPASLDHRPVGPIRPIASSSHNPPLRC